MDNNFYGHSKGHSLTRAEGLVLVSDTPKGRGVFATQSIPKGTIIDISPVLILSAEEVEKHTNKTCLQHYTYYWPSGHGNSTTQAIALGLGSMFNHSTSKQNIVWQRNIEAEYIIYTAHRDIPVGEELCISYGSGRLWFEDADMTDSDDEWKRISRTAEHTKAAWSSELEMSGIGSIDL